MNKRNDKRVNNMSNQQEKDEEDNLEEKNAYERFEYRTKQIIFNVLYVLLKDEEGSTFEFVLLAIIGFLQICQSSFLPIVNFFNLKGQQTDYPYNQPEFTEKFNFYLDFVQLPVWLAQTTSKVSYSFSRKRFAYVWPVQALRSSVGLFVTVLFMPFLEENGPGWFLDAFHDERCWVGSHIIHASISSAVSLVFIAICVIVSLTYYDNNITSNDFSARVDQRIVLLIISYLDLRNYRILRPFYNDNANIFYTCLSGLFLWGNIVLLFVKLMEPLNFDGGYQIYLLGVPIVIFIIIFEPDRRKKLLIMNINNIEKGEEAMLQIRYYIRLVQFMEKDRDSNITLKGYLYHHEDSCSYSDCQLKKYKQEVKTLIDGLKGDKNYDVARQQKLMKKCLLEHAKSLYRAAIARFPDFPSLKIQYAIFLKEMMGNTKDALIQLKIASKQSLAFDEQFVVFRQMKLTEESSSPNSETDNGDIDVVGKLAYESAQQQLKESILKSSNLHFEFWNQLLNERPDIDRLNLIGQRISRSIRQIDELWDTLQKINAYQLKTSQLYAQFLMNILNDKTKGEALIKRAQETRAFNFGSNLDDLFDTETLNQNATPYIIIDGDQQNLGMMLDFNKSLLKMFGYTSSELLHVHLDKLLPDIYTKDHNAVLEKAIQISENEEIQYKDRQVFGKHKSGYIFPITILIKMLKNVRQEIKFIAIFKQEKVTMHQQFAYMLINKEKQISMISSNCLTYLDIDQNKVIKFQNKKIDLPFMCPEIFTSSYTDTQKLEWKIPDVNHKLAKRKQSSANVQGLKRKKTIHALRRQSTRIDQYPTFNYVLETYLQIIKMGSQGEIGWFVKISDHSQGELRIRTQIKKVIAIPQFQFQFHQNSGLFIREIMNDEREQIYRKNKTTFTNFMTGQNDSSYKEEIKIQTPRGRYKIEDKSNADELSDLELTRDNLLMKGNQEEQKIMNSSRSQKQQLKSQRNQDDQEETASLLEIKQKWGRGIKIYKLVNGMFQTKDFDEEAKLQQKLQEEKKKKEMEELNEFGYNQEMSQKEQIQEQSVRKVLEHLLHSKESPRAINNLQLVTNLVIAFFLALAIAEYIFNNSQFRDINENFNLLRMSYGRLSEIQRVAYNVRTLININEKKQQVYNNYTTEPDFIEFIKQDMEDSMNNLWYLNRNITYTNLPLSQRQKQLVNEKSVYLYFRQNKDKSIKTLVFSMKEAMLQIISSIFTVRHLDIREFTEENEDMFFILYNSYNDFLLSTQRTSLLYMEDLIERSENKMTLIIIVFIISVIVVCFASFMVLPMIVRVNKVRIKVLLLFLDIPSNNVSQLADKCTDFIFKLEDDLLNEVLTDQQKSEDDDNLEQKIKDKVIQNFFSKKSSQKIPRNAVKSYARLYIKLLLIIAVILGYFSAMFVISLNYIHAIDIEATQLNVLSQAEYEYAFAQNVQREMIYSPEMPIFNKTSFKVAKDSIITIQKLQQSIRNEMQRSDDGEYKSEFINIFKSNLCENPLINITLIPEDCSTMLNHAAFNVKPIFHITYYQGYQTILIKYFGLLQENIKQYIIEMDSTTNTTKSQQLLFDSRRFYDLYVIQYRFIKDINRYLIKILQEQETQDYQSKTSMRLALFICFLIGLAIFYLLLWIPFVRNLHNQILRTKGMLNIIPMDVIIRMPRMREFLKSQDFISGKI
ncbi:UNKNOWN [Stylonychia lemnae]|uniref:PAS domain-containing protein n=1 Tax=Stylonychia lemnae TaxID=5949 RepID=A0A078A626_STYLE|nr:UNKNOWN [Stylonychia lemnae]|eukprot:CDW77649.1 UNKNOWN [Stylonychia lemnae]